MPVLLPGILAPLILVGLVTLEQFELPSIIGVPAKVNIFSIASSGSTAPSSAPSLGRRPWPRCS